MSETVLVAGLPLSTVLAVASLVILALSLLLVFSKRGSKQQDAKPLKALNGHAINVVASATAAEDEGKPLVRIMYGTQTGTAERFSKQLGNDVRRKYGDGVVVQVVDLENLKRETLSKPGVVLLLMATYGDGEPTDNAADFYSWACSEADAVAAGDKQPFLQDVSFGVFGLGNKQYEHFNAVGKRMHSALQALGATSLVSLGCGDDDDCIDDDYEKWAAELMAGLDAAPQLSAAANGAAMGAGAEMASAAYELEVLPAGTPEVAPFKAGGGTNAHDPLLASIGANRELHGPASERSCRHVEIDLGRDGPRYETGDHVAIYPANSDAVVAEAARLLGVSLDTVFRLAVPKSGSSSGSLGEPLPGPLSLRTALARFTDLLASPRKDALEALASCATDSTEAAKLRRLASADGRAEYHAYVLDAKRSLLEVMADFPSAKPRLGLFFGSIAPRLQPRFYSISSSATMHPRSVHVTCAVVCETMPTGRAYQGVCSTWLAAAAVGATVPVFIRRSTFKLPAQPTAPVVMVGPGTGLAPFRGFMQERALLASTSAAAAPAQLGQGVLFFGCRRRDHDYIYQEEIEELQSQGAISQLHVAFSREGQSKVYVQHHMEQQGQALWEQLGDPYCHVYVCGDAKHMAKDVHRALVGIAQRWGKMGTAQAEAFVKELSDKGRYRQDVW